MFQPVGVAGCVEPSPPTARLTYFAWEPALGAVSLPGPSRVSKAGGIPGRESLAAEQWRGPTKAALWPCGLQNDYQDHHDDEDDDQEKHGLDLALVCGRGHGVSHAPGPVNQPFPPLPCQRRLTLRLQQLADAVHGARHGVVRVDNVRLQLLHHPGSEGKARGSGEMGRNDHHDLDTTTLPSHPRCHALSLRLDLLPNGGGHPM